MGLYPATSNLTGILRHVTLERGLILGAAVITASGAAALYSVLEWQRRHFGTMDLSRLARVVIPSATGLALGSEILLFSLFFSTLQLNVRHAELSPKPALAISDETLTAQHASDHPLP